MDNKKIATELVKMAKSLTGGKNDVLTNRIEDIAASLAIVVKKQGVTGPGVKYHIKRLRAVLKELEQKTRI